MKKPLIQKLELVQPRSVRRRMPMKKYNRRREFQKRFALKVFGHLMSGDLVDCLTNTSLAGTTKGPAGVRDLEALWGLAHHRSMT